ncbi:MAG: serine/threonine protein phosphatase [Candidatus Bathyarchaeota archaeon]|nr:MAG: serine/threonine protein phosphatase [Candidatus Bathyarchaeota archaeon]
MLIRNRSPLFILDLPILSQFHRIIVIGDLHGDYCSFTQVEAMFNSTRDMLLFLGDYGDRGSKSIEVIRGVKNLQDKYPKQVLALMGNHEDYTNNGRPKFSPCTLIDDVRAQQQSWERYFRGVLLPFLQCLYLSVLIPNHVLFVHGGVSSQIMNKKNLLSPSQKVVEDILWSDPVNSEGEYPNPRGAGVKFGRDISQLVCRHLGISKIVRAHDPRIVLDGPCIQHNGRVITVNSSSVYGGRPFVLVLPSKHISQALMNIDSHTRYLG